MRRIRTIFFASIVCLSAASLSAREPLTVGSAVASPGQKVSGWIDVPKGSDEGTKIPVTVAHGAADGPILALIAGTHGYEYTSIIALPRVAAALDPARMRGSVILVHMANPETFYGRRVYYGSDRKNLNRMYPGNPDGTLSERIAYAITTHVIDKATHLIDMHCGDGNESLRPYSYWMPIGDDKVDGPAREMVLAFGLDHIVVDRTRPTDPKKTLYTSTTAMVRGKPAITTESGGLGLTDDASVDAHVAGALSVANHLGIMDARSVRVTHPVWYEKSEVLRAPVTGIWRPAVDRMHTVAKDTLIGRILDPFGNTLREIRAPFAGEMLYVVATPPVSEGEPLAMVAAQGAVSSAASCDHPDATIPMRLRWRGESVLVIAVLKEEDSLLTSERERLSAWAPVNGWSYIEYTDAVDLLARVTDLSAEVIHEIEIVAHGNPAECDDVALGNVRTFGESLRRVKGFSRATVVYLSGCNTGLRFGGDCIAGSLAESAQASVCGSRGYLAGTHAERNERCVPSFRHAGILYEAFDDAIEGVDGNVWRCFGLPLKAANGDDMEIKISTSGFRPVNLAGEKAAQLRAAVEEAIQRPPADSAPYRIAPDLRFAIRLSDGEHIFELLAGGSVLRDPVSRRVWQLPGGRRLLESLWPFRDGAIPAA